jgi:lipopolysaccharide biosynthesis regulator YciM
MSMGVDVGGGKVVDYPVVNGKVHVDDPAHARALTREVGELAANIPSHLNKGASWSCPKCAFEAWAFSAKCPRCATKRPRSK